MAEALPEKLAERDREIVEACKVANAASGRDRGAVCVGSEIKKTRPCLVLTTDIVNEHRRTVVVIPLLTARQAAPPLLVPVECAGREAVAVTDQIRAVAKERLEERMGTVSPEHLRAVEEGVRRILEL